MPVPSSGQIRISDLVAEFGGDAPHALSEYYRGGARVPSNNTNIPTSGQFRMSNGYGAVNEIAIAATSGTNVDLSSLFGGNWTSTVPKRLTIGSGVTIGGTGSSAAIIIPSNMAGTLEIDNAGSVLGFGGAANGGAGGNAIQNLASGVTINNTGLLAGGGGGGALGGVGGDGSTTGMVYEPSSGHYYGSGYQLWDDNDVHRIQWNYSVHQVFNSGMENYSVRYYSSYGPLPYNGWDYYRGPMMQNVGEWGRYYYAVRRQQNQTTIHTGGSGGSGGVGQGYNQTNTSGSSGAAGGTNAGTGGTGGAGATYGTAGSTGSTGANGNYTSGLAGSSGGVAGAAVDGATVTMNNTGTIYGAVA